MTFNDYLIKPASKKITLVEIDSPLNQTWINYQPGIWFTTITPGSDLVEDDNGNFGYWGDRNDAYYNIESLNVGGELYPEVASLALCISTEKSWYYDSATTYFYAHFEAWNPPEYYATIAPGAVIGFTNQLNGNNYYEDIYYEPLVTGIPNLSKKKDALFFGLLQYQGGTISFNNTGGYFDDFANRDLYGQPVRIRLSFEGLAYADSLLVYSGRVGKTSSDFTSFKLQVEDTRKLLSRQLPINVFDSATYATMDDKYIGTPIPLIFGPVINVPAYRTSAGNWKFADTTYNSILATIAVTDKDGVTFAHGGTETDGTFTGADTTDNLYVTCEQSTVANGLDIISDILENYEGKTYNTTNYDTVEWELEKAGVLDEGLWIGKGNLMTSIDVIEQVCTDNQGVFDVLADGRFTFRSYNPDRIPSHEIFQDELLDDPSKTEDPEEYLTSVKIEYAKDWNSKDFELYTNEDYQAEVFGRSRQYKEQVFTTALTSETDATALSESVMELSKVILPAVRFNTKTQNIALRVLDKLMYTFSRQNGNSVIARSKYQVLGISLDLVNYEMGLDIKQIETDDNVYIIIDGGTSITDYSFYDGGSSTTTPDTTISGGSA